MPISSALPQLAKGGEKVMKLKKNGNNKIIAKIISMEVAKAAPKGLKRVGHYWVPLVPAGKSAAEQLIKKAHMEFFKKRVNPKLCGFYISKAVSMVAPMCPKTGLGLLYKDLTKCISLWKKGQPKLFGMMFAKAVVNYYKRGRIK